ncbi:MAG: 3-isopropylmalate dehydrogenase [Bdellovibrionales bacterium]|nr:3-isopropylmalate dehydrogenase [Bdellovibrionales bacterium]
MSSVKKAIAILAGDGIGPEVMTQALRVLCKIEELYGHEFRCTEGLIGGAAFDVHGMHFPKETEEIARSSDAILFGSVGGPVADGLSPKWKDCEKHSILGLRKAFAFNANFRPARVYPALQDRCPLKRELVEQGVDLLVIRELLGDIYFGFHETVVENGVRVARDIAEYTETQIRSIAEVGFRAAQERKKKLVSVDKANVLDTSRLWRTVIDEVAQKFPEVSYSHMYVDNCAMQIIQSPAQFDVILTSNLFGDILSDAAAVLPGSLGLTPSASLSASGFGMYEPSGGSAQDIAGLGVANPAAQILCVAMMLRFSFGLSHEADVIERAVEEALNSGCRTQDIAIPGQEVVNTSQFTDKVLEGIR